MAGGDGGDEYGEEDHTGKTVMVMVVVAGVVTQG